MYVRSNVISIFYHWSIYFARNWKKKKIKAAGLFDFIV